MKEKHWRRGISRQDSQGLDQASRHQVEQCDQVVDASTFLLIAHIGLFDIGLQTGNVNASAKGRWNGTDKRLTGVGHTEVD